MLLKINNFNNLNEHFNLYGNNHYGLNILQTTV